MILYSDQKYLYALVSKRGSFYYRKKGKKRKRVYRRIYSFKRVGKVPSVPRRRVRRKKKPVIVKRAPTTKPLAGKPVVRERANVWISRNEWLYRLQKKYGKFDYEFISWPKKIWRYFLTGKKFLNWRKMYPPYGPRYPYIVFEAFYVARDEDEGTVHLIRRARDIRKKPSAEAVMKLFSREQREQFTLSELMLQLPPNMRDGIPLTFKEIIAKLPQIEREQIESIENPQNQTRQSPDSLHVVELAGWAIYGPVNAPGPKPR